jgi:tellurite resistance protein TerC
MTDNGLMHKRKKRDPIITTIQQAKRLIKVVIGFTVVAFGFVMLVTPGPGIAAIVVGLAILGTEFVWAKRLMKRFEKEAVNVKNSFVNNFMNNKKNQ